MLAWFTLHSVCAKEGWWWSDCSPRHVGRAALRRGRIQRLVKEMYMLDEIRAKRDEIYAIARKHKAEKLWVFGSCARKEERPDSDVDLLVKFGGNASLLDIVHIRDAARNLFSREVDVVSDRGLSPFIGKYIQEEAVPI